MVQLLTQKYMEMDPSVWRSAEEINGDRDRKLLAQIKKKNISLNAVLLLLRILGRN